MSNVLRRDLLGALSVLGATTVAGCLSGDDEPTQSNQSGDGGDNESTDVDTTENETGESDSTPEIVSTSFEVSHTNASAARQADGECMTLVTYGNRHANWIQLQVSESAFTLLGDIPRWEPRENSSQQLKLKQPEIVGNQLSFQIASSERDGDEECTPTAGRAEYEASASITEPDAIESVSVTHPGGESYELSKDGEFVVPTASDEQNDWEEQPGIVEYALQDYWGGGESNETSPPLPSGHDISVRGTTVTIDGWFRVSTRGNQHVTTDGIDLNDDTLRVDISLVYGWGPSLQVFGSRGYEAKIELEQPIDPEQVQVNHSRRRVGPPPNQQSET